METRSGSNTKYDAIREARKEAAAARACFVPRRDCSRVRDGVVVAAPRGTSGGAQSARVKDASVPRRVHARWLPEA